MHTKKLNQLPKVSVVIPTYNRAHFIEKCVSSVLDQTFKPEEIIVVDDGSSDGTWKKLQRMEFKQSFENNTTLRYIYKTHGGVSSARNIGIKKSTGEYVAFLDSDDSWKKNKLERQLRSLEMNRFSCRISHSDEIWIRNGIRVNPMKKHHKSGGNLFEKCLKMCCISPSTALVHKTVFDDIGYFDENLKACEDYDFWLRFCAHENVHFVPEALVIKNGGHSDQLSKAHWGMDRFRIYSLENLLKDKNLGTSCYHAALDELINKLRVVFNGAVKRRNDDLAAEMVTKKSDYERLQQRD